MGFTAVLKRSKEDGKKILSTLFVSKAGVSFEMIKNRIDNIRLEGSMEIRKLRGSEVKKVYEKDMHRDFPEEEIKPLGIILDLIGQGHYCCYGIFEEERLCAYLFFVWERRKIAMLDYFAVLPEFRRKGVGGEAIRLAVGELAKECFEGILFEIEKISLAANDCQKQQRMDRKKFYLRNGCLESGLESEIFGTGYEILYLLIGKKRLNYREIEKSYQEIYQRMVKKKHWKNNIIICREKRNNYGKIF